jgi:hypothetical protein
MKCEFCTWDERPESIPALTRHLNGNHWGLEEYLIVWRSGELILARGAEASDIEIEFDRPKFIVPPEPPVVSYETFNEVNAELVGTVLINEGTGEIKASRSLDQDKPLSPGDDVTPLIGQ